MAERIPGVNRTLRELSLAFASSGRLVSYYARLSDRFFSKPAEHVRVEVGSLTRYKLVNSMCVLGRFREYGLLINLSQTRRSIAF